MGHKARQVLVSDPVAGYVESGAFLRDVTQLGCADRYDLKPSTASPTAFSKELPAAHRANFLVLASLLDSGSLPFFHYFRPAFTFGQPVFSHGAYSTTRGLHFIEDSRDWLDRSFPLATDGSFNLHVLVADGRVAALSREEEGVLGNWFPDLNSYLWTMVWLSRAAPASEILEAISKIEGAEDYCSELEERMEMEEE